MLKHSTYKALLLSLSLFLGIGLVLTQLYLKSSKKEDGFSVDYILEEIEEEEEELIEEDFKEIETHQAQNQAKEIIKQIQQRQSQAHSEIENLLKEIDEAIERSRELPESSPVNLSTTYTQVEKLINNEPDNRKSSVSYILKGRQALYLPNPVYTCPNSGIVVINIKVNSLGEVINTDVDKSKSTTDKCLKDQALEYANKAMFDVLEHSDEIQSGSISYRFIGD